MKTKVSEATEIQLDWMVAKCEGYFEKVSRNGLPVGKLDSWVWVALHPNAWRLSDYRLYCPTSDPAQAYPIIEREKICTEGRPGHTEGWAAHYSKKNEKDYFYCVGPTPLVSAMRCYVSSTLGDEVEIPEELAK